MNRPRFIAVVGGSASGKSRLAADMRDWLGEEAGHISLDDFYQDLGHLTEEQRGLVNFDDPKAIDWDCLRLVMESLESGSLARLPVYDFTTHTRTSETKLLAGGPVILLEGLWLLHHDWLREKFDFSVFVDCPEEERLKRRIERDVKERGRTEESVRKQFAEHVQPMHAAFVEPQKEWAGRLVTSPMSEEELDSLLEECGCP